MLRLHRLMIGFALVAATIFFASYGVIGLRTWSY
jgi:hypothetical protein